MLSEMYQSQFPVTHRSLPQAAAHRLLTLRIQKGASFDLVAVHASNSIAVRMHYKELSSIGPALEK